MTDVADHRDIDVEDALRADLYDLLGVLLARPATRETLRTCQSLSGDHTDLGAAVAELAARAAETTPKAVEREFNRLFIGIGRGELLPYASFYMTGFLNEKPLAVLRQDMVALSMRRADSVFEPEDNIASLCEMMAGLIRGRFGAPAPLGRQKDFYFRHLAPWAGHFFADLEKADGAWFYAPVGTIGRLFTDIDAQAFRMTGDSAA
ncbi:TorD/DmsD family molecular chaperone [Oceanomicrobium pacificus]|uniref:Molecular chaperone TorD n=1 Tax=Oceanomicrobium pacificus TaxID=2692916 RepID=A0A6B0TYW3_9RHOB|nr:molecular chaperone TorD family protein [Oceanomicrobium pacificus]MXU66452.1 molecular chaperone TorD [Oceanomicrobium pacificus]